MLDSNISSDFSACVVAIVVTYCPDMERLGQLLESLAVQVDRVVIVDNTPGGEADLDARGWQKLGNNKITVVCIGENIGIAEAINVGIDRARSSIQPTHILLSDQDSVPDQDMVVELLKESISLKERGESVGAVGPTYYDESTGKLSLFQLFGRGSGFYRLGAAIDKSVKCWSLISSGCLIPISVIDDVGGMDGRLFIDHVDIEWGFRAISKGYSLFGVRDARMAHQRGDSGLSIWVGRWKVINFYSAERMYFQFRNYVFTLRLHYIPLLWKLRSSLYWGQMLYACLLFSSDKPKYARQIIRSIRDGFLLSTK
ncbi:MAG: glycosyltransferase family 2 protein [Spongiibacteraceae bacterium]